MNDETKLMLSDPELKIVRDSELILTKHRIIHCVYELFNTQVNNIKPILNNLPIGIHPGIIESMPKISKGENYLRFPFVMLDYPALFGKDIFSLRTMFWWGNFFSVTLHLSGKYTDEYVGKIMSNMPDHATDLFICINPEQWQHHFQPSNYLPVTSLSQERIHEILIGRKFIKIAMKFELSHWNEMNDLLPRAYNKILGLLNG